MRSVAEFRKNYAEVVYRIKPEDLMISFVDHNIVNILSNRDQKGRRVMIVNLGCKK